MQSLRSLARAATSLRAFSTSTPRPLAKMMLIGRLADTPEIVPTSTGRDLVKYAVGVSSGPRDEQGNRAVSWFKVASFTEGPGRDLLTSLPKGTLLHVEADSRMDTFKDKDGKNRTQLNLLQRNFEVLSRPRVPTFESSSGAEAHSDPAEEPLSGIGHS